MGRLVCRSDVAQRVEKGRQGNRRRLADSIASMVEEQGFIGRKGGEPQRFSLNTCSRALGR